MIAALQALDLQTCRACNRLSLRPLWRGLFASVSRLGDGVFWYALITALPILHGWAGLHLGLHMLATGAACTLIYTSFKRWTRRRRPCEQVDDLWISVAPLDRFSFPSGHTLHACAFTVLAVAAWPLLGWLLLPFTLLVALSRLVLGLHYPSDILAGAAIGICTARLSCAVAEMLGIGVPATLG